MKPDPTDLTPGWQLRVLNGPLRGTVHHLGDRFSIGRAASNDLQLVHESVSRQHAHIAVDDQGLHVLVDLVSGNGTFIDGHRVERKVLRPHTVLRVAGIELVYEPADQLGPTIEAIRGEERFPVTLTGPGGTEHGGHLLDEILEYRTLRARCLRGGLQTRQRDRFDALGDVLKQPPGPDVERRAFWRFECWFPATLRVAADGELSCWVRDLGVDGAQVTAAEHEVEFDEIVWLSLLLESGGRTREEVLGGRVAWIDGDNLGLAFAGAPRSTKRNPALREVFDDGAPTVRIDMTPSTTQDLAPLLGSSKSRAKAWTLGS